jgi:hypothetical protein
MIKLKDFVLIHSTYNDNLDSILDSGYLYGVKYSPELYEGRFIPKNKYIFFTLVSSKVPYDPEFFGDDATMLVFDPKIVYDYKDDIVFNNHWRYGEKDQYVSRYYQKDKGLTYNLNRFYDVAIQRNGLENVNHNELVVEADKISVDKYLRAIF